MKLKHNQSAIILEASENGEINVDVASPDIDGLTGSLCRAIAQKLMDEKFQEELMAMLPEEE